MSLGISAVAWAGIAAAAVAAGSAYVSHQDAKAAMGEQRKAAEAALKRQKDLDVRSDLDFNRLNKKKPNIQGAIDTNAQGALAGTMLTGPQGAGVDPSMLGKKTLMGG